MYLPARHVSVSSSQEVDNVVMITVAAAVGGTIIEAAALIWLGVGRRLGDAVGGGSQGESREVGIDG